MWCTWLKEEGPQDGNHGYPRSAQASLERHLIRSTRHLRTAQSLESSHPGVRGRKDREAISHRTVKEPRDHAFPRRRVRAIEYGEVHIDIAFIGAPTCDEYGNMRANGGKSDCGVFILRDGGRPICGQGRCRDRLSRSVPNLPASISMVNVDYVCVVDESEIRQRSRRRCKADDRCEKDHDGRLTAQSL